MKQVAIIGRVNVGKSTLFNKLIEQQKALISNIPGTTRDLNFGICDWQGKKFEVADTGGLFETNNKKNIINIQVEKKAREIIKKTNLILFLVDAKDGVLKDDRLIAQLLKKSQKPFLLVANKIDKQKSFKPEEFKKLGLGEVIGIAAVSGAGVGDLLDKVIKKLQSCHPEFISGSKNKKNSTNYKILKQVQDDKKTRDDIPNLFRDQDDIVKVSIVKVSIIGKPNVGKSSLLNQILGEDRVIVSPIPHTTREPQDTLLEYENNIIKLVDTAGIRRKTKVKAKSLESAGIAMSIKALKKSDIVLFVLDMSEPLSSQDAQLAGLIIDSGVSIIFVANKYDLLEIDENSSKKLTAYIQKYLPFMEWSPIIFTSALSGKNTHKILKLIMDIKAAREKEIDKQELNNFINNLMKKMPPPRQPRKFGSQNKTRAFISKTIQKDTNPPVFEINITNLAEIPESYLRYLENNLRKKFKFEGTPIKIVVQREKR